jgi:protocatechuate 3,4-dioxygenase beta subunit
MDNDDQLVGRILSRREVLALIGAAGIAPLAGCAPAGPAATGTANGTTASGATAAGGEVLAPSAAAPVAATAPSGSLPSCVVRPELTEGPYFVDEHLDRSDIRSDPASGKVSPGTPLSITLAVSQVDGSACKPLGGVTVDLWHCDAVGVYSDVVDSRFDSRGQKFLRGSQVTDADGIARFTTIYPGWYQGRAVHIHFKLRTVTATGESYDFTSQWFFDEALTDTVHAQEPYASKGRRTLLNEGDGIFREAGSQMILPAAAEGEGVAARFDIGLVLG